MQKKDESESKPKDKQLWRDLVAFWFLGLCNNYGYVVMLSAAHDITAQFGKEDSHDAKIVSSEGRECNLLSTGAILLADILPSCIMKIVTPFLPLCIHVRMALAVALSAGGFLLVGLALNPAMAILGVVLISASCGMGETTFLAYSSKYNKNVISTWSSGTGAAGVTGSLSYAVMLEFISARDTMLIMLIVPMIQALAFWLLLRKPENVPESSLEDEKGDTNAKDRDEDDGMPLVTLKEKFIYIGKLLKYMIPLTLVYFFEYFANQGVYELIYFARIFLNQSQQYRWYNVLYQIGVFISRSSVNLVHFRRVWILSVLQFVNALFFLLEAIYFFTPTIWIIFILILWEGLVGGGAYVNTYYRMAREVPRSKRLFAMSVVSFSDSPGIILAGFLAMPVHNAICKLTAPTRAVTW